MGVSRASGWVPACFPYTNNSNLLLADSKTAGCSKIAEAEAVVLLVIESGTFVVIPLVCCHQGMLI